MEHTLPSWLPWAGLIFGILIGILVGYFLRSPGPSLTEVQNELDKTRKELEGYRSKVTEHFAKTADLVNDLTKNYKAVYEHLASSSQQLCEDIAPGNRIGFKGRVLIAEQPYKSDEIQLLRHRHQRRAGARQPS